jgi:predicted RNA-binding protein
MRPKYWIIVASRDHVRDGVAEGIAQTCHGNASPLQKMHKDDWLIYYSPKAEMGKDDRCQSLTAIGRLQDEHIYQQDMGSGFVPFCRKVEFQDCHEVSFLPMISELSFIRDKQRWGVPFRYGMLEIPEQDFRFIARHMLSEEQLAVI